MKSAVLIRFATCLCLFAAGVSLAQQARPGWSQVQIDAAFVEYRLADIEPLVREQRVTVETLKDLWRTGQGRLLAAPSIITQSGQEAIAKSVTEIIYPTEYTVEPTVERGASAPTNAVVVGKAAAVIPCSFEMREIGSILQIVPEVSADGGVIHLVMNPQFVRSPEWKPYEIVLTGFDGQATRAQAMQPMFPVVSVSTSIRVRNGVTVLTGGGACDGRNDAMVYVFVTATLVDAEGRPLADPVSRRR